MYQQKHKAIIDNPLIRINAKRQKYLEKRKQSKCTITEVELIHYNIVILTKVVLVHCNITNND